MSASILALYIMLTENTYIELKMDIFDHIITSSIRQFTHPRLNFIMIAITTIGSGYCYALVVLIILLILSFYQRWREACILSLCLIGACSSNYLLKHFFERSRPNLARVVDISGYSFPSGHAMVSLCFYGLIAYLVSRQISSRCWRFLLFAFTTLLIIAIGISRIYLGVHYPSDVIGGYLAGTTWLFICISLLKWWENNRV